jgi:hypothetical protein
VGQALADPLGSSPAAVRSLSVPRRCVGQPRNCRKGRNTTEAELRSRLQLPPWFDPARMQPLRDESTRKPRVFTLGIAPPLPTLGAGSGLKPNARGVGGRDLIKRLPLSREPLPLLGSNQDSPDPEGPPEPPKFQQLAVFYASSCHPMLGFAGFHAVLCRTLLAQMSEFAGPSAEHARPATTFTRHRT